MRTLVRHVRDECPVQTACFRRDLPRVVGFPHRCVLLLDTTPQAHTAGVPVASTSPPASAPWSPATHRFQHCSVSGFPLPCLRELYTIPPLLPMGQERLGPPKFFDASLPACHGLRTPADLSLLAHTDGLVLPSVCVKTLGVRNKRLFEAVPALQGTRLPLRPTGYSVYASSILFTVISTTPPWTQDSIRVGGSPLPDRDFHPARDAKLILAR